jgi:hypothetical protein
MKTNKNQNKISQNKLKKKILFSKNKKKCIFKRSGKLIFKKILLKKMDYEKISSSSSHICIFIPLFSGTNK